MWNSIQNSISSQLYGSVTTWNYVFFTVFILWGMLIFTAFYDSGISSFGYAGLFANIPFLVIMWSRPFNIVYKVLITSPNIILPLILYIKSAIDEKNYHKKYNEAIEKFNNGDSSEAFRMGVPPQHLSIPEGYVLIRRRGNELNKLDKIPENEWFEYTIYNGLEESDIKPYLSFRSGRANIIKRYYLIKEGEFEGVQQFVKEVNK